MVKFNPSKDIPDLSGKVILVTGGNTGLGLATIKLLLPHRPSHIYLASRTKSRAESAIATIDQEQPNHAPVSFLQMDLTSFESIRKAAVEFTSKSDRLDILINNAGIMATPPGLTSEGYEVQFGTNHMGHALLTKLLLPTLSRTADMPGVPSGSVRIVNLSSRGESFAPKTGIDLAAIKTPDAGGKNSWIRYGQGKLANVLHAKALAVRYPKLVCVAVHPGFVSTELARGSTENYGAWATAMVKVLSPWSNKAEVGALGQVWAATGALRSEKRRDGVESGVFYWPVGVTGKDSKAAMDEGYREKLWEWTERELEGWLAKN